MVYNAETWYSKYESLVATKHDYNLKYIVCYYCFLTAYIFSSSLNKQNSVANLLVNWCLIEVNEWQIKNNGRNKTYVPVFHRFNTLLVLVLVDIQHLYHLILEMAQRYISIGKTCFSGARFIEKNKYISKGCVWLS